MDRSENYRRFAQECLEIAATVKSPDARAVLLLMAQVWVRLADQHAVEVESDELA